MSKFDAARISKVLQNSDKEFGFGFKDKEEVKAFFNDLVDAAWDRDIAMQSVTF